MVAIVPLYGVDRCFFRSEPAQAPPLAAVLRTAARDSKLELFSSFHIEMSASIGSFAKTFAAFATRVWVGPRVPWTHTRTPDCGPRTEGPLSPTTIAYPTQTANELSPPQMPFGFECCNDQCPHCVWTLYFEDVARWRAQNDH